MVKCLLRMMVSILLITSTMVNNPTGHIRKLLAASKLELYVRVLPETSTVCLEVDSDGTVQDIVNEIKKMYPQRKGTFSILVGGENVDTTAFLSDIGISSESVIEATFSNLVLQVRITYSYPINIKRSVISLEVDPDGKVQDIVDGVKNHFNYGNRGLVWIHLEYRNVETTTLLSETGISSESRVEASFRNPFLPQDPHGVIERIEDDIAGYGLKDFILFCVPFPHQVEGQEQCKSITLVGVNLDMKGSYSRLPKDFFDEYIEYYKGILDPEYEVKFFSIHQLHKYLEGTPSDTSTANGGFQITLLSNEIKKTYPQRKGKVSILVGEENVDTTAFLLDTGISSESVIEATFSKLVLQVHVDYSYPINIEQSIISLEVDPEGKVQDIVDGVKNQLGYGKRGLVWIYLERQTVQTTTLLSETGISSESLVEARVRNPFLPQDPKRVIRRIQDDITRFEMKDFILFCVPFPDQIKEQERCKDITLVDVNSFRKASQFNCNLPKDLFDKYIQYYEEMLDPEYEVKFFPMDQLYKYLQGTASDTSTATGGVLVTLMREIDY